MVRLQSSAEAQAGLKEQSADGQYEAENEKAHEASVGSQSNRIYLPAIPADRLSANAGYSASNVGFSPIRAGESLVIR